MGDIMTKHFVTFCSPGTIVAETTTKPINSWDVNLAGVLLKGVKERYGAVPYGFYFTTRERKDDELDSKVVKQSGMYFLGGKMLTLEEIRDRNDPHDRILISNMEGNKWDKMIENNNFWRVCLPFQENDRLLNSPPQEG